MWPDTLIRVAMVALSIALSVGLVDARGWDPPSARATVRDAFAITSPVDASVLGDGNLVLVEGVAFDPVDGQVDKVEIKFDDETWSTVELRAGRTSWSHLWADPEPGPHRIWARAFGVGDQAVVEQSVTVQVQDTWATPYRIANPYATRGSYKKGQLHTHSTNSFDGWESLAPGGLAQAYRERGYQFVAITDHDVISNADEIEDRNFVTIAAYESTSDSGHITGLWTSSVASAQMGPQQRLDAIAEAGGLAILNHPNYRIGWTGPQLRTLRGYFAVEVYNGITSASLSENVNLRVWHQALNAKGWPNRVWAVAVDDSHSAGAIDRGWVMVKAPRVTEAAIRQALESGAFYASNGPIFSELGVLGGAVTASSPNAISIRFIDQDMRVLKQGPPSEASYKPTGNERWVRVEAVMGDGRTAWSQPFWLLPNAPKAVLDRGTLTGQTIPGARVHVSDNGQYLGNTLAGDDGTFSFTARALDSGPHQLWITAIARWADRIESSGTLLTYDDSG